MGEWKITIVNKTGDGGLSPRNVAAMMFQTDTALEVDSWSNAWKVAEIGYPGNVGPIVLPTRVQFYVKDLSFGNPRTTGPFDVTFGQTVSVVQPTVDDAPRVTTTNEQAPEGQIKVVNEQGNAQPLEMALYKDGRPLLLFKNVRPANAVYLSVEPALYIADVDRDSVSEGDDFKAVVQAQRSTKFKLFPAKRRITIEIIQSENQQLSFVEL